MPKIKPRANEKHLFNFHRSFLAQRKRIRNLIYIITPGIVVSIFIENDYGYLITVGLLVVAAIYAIYIFTIWYQNVGIVTNQRVIIVEKSGLFHQKVNEFDALQIRNVTYEIKGLLGHISHSGKITLELAGDDIFEISSVYGSEEIHDSIRALVRAHRY